MKLKKINITPRSAPDCAHIIRTAAMMSQPGEFCWITRNWSIDTHIKWHILQCTEVTRFQFKLLNYGNQYLSLQEIHILNCFTNIKYQFCMPQLFYYCQRSALLLAQLFYYYIGTVI